MLFLHTLKLHIELARKNLVAVIIILISAISIIESCISENVLLHGVGYLAAIWLCMYITDVVVQWKPKINSIGFPIKKPVGMELWTIFICTALGLGFLIFRFASDWENLTNAVKLASLPLMLFTFPVVLALIYLFRFKYKLPELGFNLNYWYLPIFIHLVFGIITLTVAPEQSHWKEAWFEIGIVFMIVEGFIGAALSEEFLRMLMQSRIGYAFNNMSLGIVIAALIWAYLHFPVSISKNPDESMFSLSRGMLQLVPLGVLWGYITYRTKSLFPVLMLHGLNLWGLQNF